MDGSTYFQDTWIPGRTDAPVESIVWHTDGIVAAGFSGKASLVLDKFAIDCIRRCLSMSSNNVAQFLTGHLDLWDLRSLKPLHSLNCQGGPIWCVSENPSSPNELAVGCEDGMVRCRI